MRTVSPPRPVSILRQGWRDRAACLGEDPALFFPQDGDRYAADKGRAICAGCTVRAQCLQFALSSPERWGTWAGLTEGERQGMEPDVPAGPRMCGKGRHVMDETNTGWRGRCRACKNTSDRQRQQEAKHDRKAAHLAAQPAAIRPRKAA